MKKKVVIGIIVAGVVAIGVAAAAIVISKNNQGQSSEPKDITTITMNAISGTPYFWSYTLENDGVVELLEEKKDEQDSEMVGTPYQILYKFKGVKPGEAKVTYDYASVADGYISERIVYKITVAEDLGTTSEIIDHAYGLEPAEPITPQPSPDATEPQDTTEEAQDIEPGIQE